MDPTVVRFLEENLVGKKCESLDSEGGLLTLEFGVPKLVVQSAWRLSSRDGMFGSGSPKNETARPMILSIRPTRLSILTDFHDLVLEFENGSRLETFADAGGYEHWNLTCGGTSMVVAGPGRLWSKF